ncbi:MAG TPA: transporter [Vicinamibacterales bacterium]|nr:transporter [Vicinamibacterales bacterium]
MRVVCAGVFLCPSPAAAQQTVSGVISFLVTNESVPTGDFQKDAAAAAATRDTIARALLVNLSSTPIPSASSGFTYRLNPELGTMERVSDSFGTFFVERALSSGRNRFSLGVSGTTAGFDRLDGLDLRDGTLVTVANQFTDESAPFDVESLTLKMRSSTMTVFGTYGLTDRLEIGGAVPFVQLHVEGSRLNVYHGQNYVQAGGSADASGIADVALRAKYTLARTGSAGFAVAGEWRLPTGDAANLLGAGRAALRVTAIASAERTRWGVHGNAGFVRGGASDELDAAGAVTYSVRPRLTLAGELLVRRLADLHEIVSVGAPHPAVEGVETFRLVAGPDATLLSSAVAGIKWNVHARMVLSGQVLWSLRQDGLTAPLTPTIGLDYLF